MNPDPADVGPPKLSVVPGSYEDLHPELVSFAVPAGVSPEEQELITNIVVLDHRSLHALGRRSSARTEIRALLVNAVSSAGYNLNSRGHATDSMRSGTNTAKGAIGLYRQAEALFHQHLQGKNRLTYLAGVAIGIAVLVLGAFFAPRLPAGVSFAIDPGTVPALLLFSGLGSIVSVLTRLDSLDLVKEISRPILIISGAGRPFVAGAFALVVYMALSSGLISISIQQPGVSPAARYLVVAFLCGFSERFAQDILSRLEASKQSAKVPADDGKPSK
jgi:hypothetical protein